MVPNFRSLDYLESGNKRQRRVHALLSAYHVMEQLLPYGPILTGTIPLEIDIENSDLDIVCCYSNDEDFYSDLVKRFANHSGFKVRRTVIGEAPNCHLQF
ncbi:MAG: DUF4269 domain-containing protein [Chryseolinea sp.]